MKHLSTIFLVLVSCAVSHAQGFRWQGIVKDANGLVVTQPVTLTFSILLNDSIVYVETKPPITPIAGQIATIVGDGIATQGSFSTIDWLNGTYSLNVKMKVGNGSVINMDTSRILIPPYLQPFSGQGSTSAGFLELKTSGEGIFIIPGGNSNESRWIIATKSFSGNFEETFNPIPHASGTIREYYIGFVLDININADSGNGNNNCLYEDTVTVADLPPNVIPYINANYPSYIVEIVTIKNNGSFAIQISNGFFLQFLRFKPNGDFQNDCGGPQAICQSKLNVRFYFPEIQELGHQGFVPISWDHDAFGQVTWMKVPSPADQFSNTTNLSCRLEVGIGDNCPGEIAVKNIFLTAIDKINGSQPIVNISSEIGTQEVATQYIGGLNDEIKITSSSVIISTLSASNLSASNLSASTITASTIDVGSGGISSSGATNYISGNLGIGTTNPTEKLDVNGRVKAKTVEITGSDIIEKVNSEVLLAPGDVVTWDCTKANAVKRSSKAYDKLVFGVVSGAGNIPHAIELVTPGILDGNTNVAIAGRLKVKVTGEVKPGDLLTTSNKPGFAMKAKNRRKREGAIIGKALSFPDEKGLVLMLVQQR